MSNHDFKELNDKEFEVLTVDILSVYFGQHIERFKVGRDGGVDGRFYTSESNEIIIQCKHWFKSGIAALLRSIKTTEALKVKRLNPSRYIFVTSLELSRANKTKIRDLFSPFILRADDIFGNEDLNDLLSKNPVVEQKHYKLWISSTNVLRIILNSAIIGRSRYKLEEIIEESKRYVITENHNQALKKLEEIHSIIITGAPGVGKTSLADQICQYYSAQEYELCFIENSLNEAEDNYDPERKQIFYYDDFLGRNFLLALKNHQDSHIINFMKRVERDPKKRFILTSRSNIFNQGKHLSDLFDIKKIKSNEYEVCIETLSDFDKAKILYNHIWFSQLEDGFIDEIYKEQRYYKIIQHKNYNPRLISFITDSYRLQKVTAENYWNYIEETLENPQGIWKNVFDVQLNEISRHVVIAVCLHGSAISESELLQFYLRLKSSKIEAEKNIGFESLTKLLVGALLNRSVIGENYVIYNLFNPSIADFVISNYMNDMDYLGELLSCLKTTGAVNNLYSLCKSKSLEQSFCESIIEKQLIRISNSDDKNGLDKFMFGLIAVASKLIKPKPNLIEYIKSLTEVLYAKDIDEIPSGLFGFIEWSVKLGLILPTDKRFSNLLQKLILFEDMYHEDYISLSKLIILNEPKGGKLTDQFKECFVEYYSDVITQEVIESDILADAYDSEVSYYGEICDFVNDIVSEMPIQFNDSEIGEIAVNCDEEDVIVANIKSGMNHQQANQTNPNSTSCSNDSSNAIEDLFDRD